MKAVPAQHKAPSAWRRPPTLAFLDFVELQLSGERRRYTQYVGPGVDESAHDLRRKPALARIAKNEIAVDETHEIPLLRRNRGDILLSSLAHKQARICRVFMQKCAVGAWWSRRVFTTILTPRSHDVHTVFRQA
jgi:hypothetical protein